MKITIIGSMHNRNKNDMRVLQQNLAQEVSASAVAWEDLVLDIANQSVRVMPTLSDTTFVLALNWYREGNKTFYRDLAFAVALYLRHKNIPFWNSEMAHQRSSTKLSCMMQLALAGIPVPRTLFSFDGKKLQTVAAEALGFPMIVKGAAASRGRNNHLIFDTGQFAALLADDEPNAFIAQQFLPNDHDLRIICFAGEPSLALRRARQNPDTHLNNTSLGGKGIWLDLTGLPAELLAACRQICKIMGREMAGIDFIPDPSSPFGYACLEVNAIPQLTSGTDVERKMQALKTTLKNIGN